MKLPAIHTMSTAPARHLLACEEVARKDLWHEHPALGMLQHWQVTARWLMARYVLTHAAPRHGIARRLCAEVCAELEVEAEVLEHHLDAVPPTDGAPRAATVPVPEARRHVLQRMVERVMAVRPGTPLFDARLLVLGQAFDRHLTQTMARVVRRAHRPEWLQLGPVIAARRRRLLSEMAGDPAVR